MDDTPPPWSAARHSPQHNDLSTTVFCQLVTVEVHTRGGCILKRGFNSADLSAQCGTDRGVHRMGRRTGASCSELLQAIDAGFTPRGEDRQQQQEDGEEEDGEEDDPLWGPGGPPTLGGPPPKT